MDKLSFIGLLLILYLANALAGVLLYPFRKRTGTEKSLPQYILWVITGRMIFRKRKY